MPNILIMVAESHSLVRFFEIASDDLRSEVLAKLGQDLRASEEPLEDDVTARLKALWEWRIQTARAGGPQDNYRSEMAAFGWTFASGELGISWGLSQLEATQAIAGQAPVDHLVVERLALLAPEHPSETVRCLALMVDGAEEDWHIHHWATDVETILKAALQSADEEASQSARAIIHRLGSRGFLQFAVLLEMGD